VKVLFGKPASVRYVTDLGTQLSARSSLSVSKKCSLSSRVRNFLDALTKRAKKSSPTRANSPTLRAFSLTAAWKKTSSPLSLRKSPTQFRSSLSTAKQPRSLTRPTWPKLAKSWPSSRTEPPPKRSFPRTLLRPILDSLLLRSAASTRRVSLVPWRSISADWNPSFRRTFSANR